jgi:hypothetical protein
VVFSRFSLNIGKGMGYRESVASTLSDNKANISGCLTNSFDKTSRNL